MAGGTGMPIVVVQIADMPSVVATTHAPKHLSAALPTRNLGVKEEKWRHAYAQRCG